MFADPSFRCDFRRDWESTSHRVFHRDLGDMWIVSSPISGQEGKSFGELAQAAGCGSIISWTCWPSTIRPSAGRQSSRTTGPSRGNSSSPTTRRCPALMIRARTPNMAFQDGGLQMLQQVLLNPQLMTIEKAIHKLTGQSAEWLGLDVGFLRPARPT